MVDEWSAMAFVLCIFMQSVFTQAAAWSVGLLTGFNPGTMVSFLVLMLGTWFFGLTLVVFVYTKMRHYPHFMGTHHTWTRASLDNAMQARSTLGFGDVSPLVDVLHDYRAMQQGLDFLGAQVTRATHTKGRARVLAFDTMCAHTAWNGGARWKVTGDPVPGLQHGLALMVGQAGEGASAPQMCLHVVFNEAECSALTFVFNTKYAQLSKAVYGTEGYVHAGVYGAAHADAVRIKAAAEEMQEDFPHARVSVHLYGRFLGGSHAVLATMAVTALPGLHVTTYTEGCFPVLHITACEALRSRIAPYPVDGKVAFVPKEATAQSGPRPSFFLNNTRLFNVLHTDDVAPCFMEPLYVHHATPILVGETQDRAHRRLAQTLGAWVEFKELSHKFARLLRWWGKGPMYTQAMVDLVQGKTAINTKTTMVTGGGQETETETETETGMWPAPIYGFLDNLLAWDEEEDSWATSYDTAVAHVTGQFGSTVSTFLIGRAEQAASTYATRKMAPSDAMRSVEVRYVVVADDDDDDDASVGAASGDIQGGVSCKEVGLAPVAAPAPAHQTGMQ